MSEVPLYAMHIVPNADVGVVGRATLQEGQGHLAHKKCPPT